MAFGAIEIPTVARSIDYTAIKQNEDAKTYVAQTNLGQQQEKTEIRNQQQVREGDNAQWHRDSKDARDKGDNEYAGDGGAGRSAARQKAPARSEDKCVVNGHQGFDMKI